MRTKGIGGHQSAAARTDEWLTPPDLLGRLGTFDLDPCAPIMRPWDTARHHYTVRDNGLVLPWFGRVWMNPPYGKALEAWLKRISQHGDGIALIFARTETRAFQNYVFETADSLLFIKNRLHFYTVDGQRAKANGGAPSVLIAYGERNVDALADSGIEGKHVLINSTPVIIVAASPSWKNVVSIALSRLNGKGELKEIYEMVQRIAPDKINRNPHYKEKIRQKLQKHFEKVGDGIYQN